MPTKIKKGDKIRILKNNPLGAKVNKNDIITITRFNRYNGTIKAGGWFFHMSEIWITWEPCQPILTV